jgi:hypothetical protein
VGLRKPPISTTVPPPFDLAGLPQEEMKMTTPVDPTFNIDGFQISQDFSPEFLQSGSPLANDINSFSHIGSFPDLVSLAVQTYDDAAHAGTQVRYEDTNVLTGNSGVSLVLTESNNTIGAIGVSGLSPSASQILGMVSHIHL